MTYTFFKWWWC